MRWYRRLAAREYDSSDRRESRGPHRTPDIAALVLHMATENTRIRGALFNLGHDIGRNTPRSQPRGTIRLS